MRCVWCFHDNWASLMCDVDFNALLSFRPVHFSHPRVRSRSKKNTMASSMTRDHGGGRRDRTLYADSPPLPPPPPPSLEIGWKVPHHGRRRRPKQILLDLVEGEKMGFRPMCLYSKCSVFLGEPNSGSKPNWAKYQYHPCAEVCQIWAIP